MSKFNINDFDAVRLIGILLDNAIEATFKSGHDGLGLTIVDQMSNSYHNLFVQYHPTDYFFTVVVIMT